MALICKICGYKQSDDDTVEYFKEKFPGMEEHDIPYYCGACLNNMSDEEYDAAKDEMSGSDYNPEPETTDYWTEEEIEKMTYVKGRE